EFQAQLADLVLKETLERLHELEVHFLGQAADIVMALDQSGRIAPNGHRFDHVGIKRALRKKFGSSSPLGRALKKLDKCAPDDFSFALRINDAPEPLEEQLRGVLVLQLNLEVPPKDFLDRLGLARAQETIIYEDAGETIAHRFVQERRRHAGIHTSAQA